MPETLPLADLLAVLRERGLPIGVREHLTVGRLLDRWQGTDPAGLRDALAAVLARNPEEVRLIRETFDELYGPRLQRVPSSQPGPRTPGRKRWGRVTGLVLASLLISSSLAKEQPPAVAVPPAPAPEATSEREPPPPPEISETFEQADWKRAGAGAAGVALLVLLWLYGTRLQREAGGLARRLWRRELDDLPRPYGYELALGQLAPALPAAALDQAAGLLGRAPAPPRAEDLDVDHSLERTLRAGLAPQIVLQERSSPRVLLVLQDTAGEMRPWRRSVNALLAGLAARGVSLDIWHFHADADQVFRGPGRDTASLERLARLRAGLPLLVISTGEGLPTGRDGRLADWVATLASWNRRAWLHPVTDAAYWRPQLRQAGTEVWPLTPGGVIAAARHLAAAPAPLRSQFPVFPDRPVAPLDVDRLRWLLFLAPRRDPDLLELLRQRFLPRLPPAALLEALEAPPLPRQPGSLLSSAEVHAFLADVLAASQPKAGSAAHARWLLDRALQEAQVPARREKGLDQLRLLAGGPMAGEVEQAAGRLPGDLRKTLLRKVGERALEEVLAAEAGERRRWRWRWPDAFELCACLLCCLLLAWGLGQWLVETKPVELLTLYKLEAVDPSGRGPVYLRVTRSSGAPATVALYRQDRNLEMLSLPEEIAGVTLEPADRGSWYYLRAWMDSDRDRLAISNSVWVRSAPVEPPAPPEAVPLAETPEVRIPSPEMNPEPTLIEEPLSTDLVEPEPENPEPATEDEGTRFGTVNPVSGEVGGLPTQPVQSEGIQEGTLTITGYPNDLPPQMLHLIGPGMPPQGAPWNGQALKLAPGEYLPVVHTPTRSIGLTRVTIQSGSTANLRVSDDEIRTVRQSLASTPEGEEGPRITAVSSDTFAPRLNRYVDVLIRGTGFDPKARVSFSRLDPGVSLQSCDVREKEINCTFLVYSEAPFYMRDGGSMPTTVMVINPDGRYATDEAYLDFSGRAF